MTPEPIQTPSYIAQYLLRGEYAIYRCKAHKAIWIMPLMLIMIFFSVIISYPDIERDNMIFVYVCLAASVISFFIYTFVYNTTEILLTNQRLIIRQLFDVSYIKLKDVGILKYEDGASQINDTKNPYKFRNGIIDIAFAMFFDIVRVFIIDKNGQDFATVRLIGLYNYKQLKKFYDAECEKLENIGA